MHRPAKRAKLVDELLAAPAWLDKWTMYFGDFFKNSAYKPSTGRPAGIPIIGTLFSSGFRTRSPGISRTNQIAQELISPPLGNSYQTPNLNWLAGGLVLNAPAQDITESDDGNVFDTFLGVAHVIACCAMTGAGIWKA